MSFYNKNFKGTNNNINDKHRKVERFVYNLNLNIGDYKWSVSNNDFKGWLLCNGRSLQRSQYPELFEIIGTSFGSTSSDNFNIPKMGGRVLGAIGITGNANDVTHALGHSIGSENITLNSTQIPAHSHTGTTASSTTGITSSGTTASSTTGLTVNSVSGHTHTYNDAYFAENTGGEGSNFGTNAAIDTDNTFIWRNASGGNDTTPQNINTSTSGGHDHTITDTGHTHTFTANITDPTHTHEFTTNQTGGGESHANVQPTLYGGNLFIFAKFTNYI
jgi:microcystin-dependent protein